jgi:hypothetical protein
VHVVHLGRPLAQARLAERIAGALEAQGLTGLVLDPRRRWFRYEGGPAEVALEILHRGPDPFGVVHGEIERQLNASFPRAHRTNPFRLFAVVGSYSFHLGIAYDHFIAGGDSIALLLKRTPLRAPWRWRRPPAAAPTCIRDLPPPAGLPSVARERASACPLFATTRRAFRPQYRLGDGGYNGFTYFRLGLAQFAALRRRQGQ